MIKARVRPIAICVFRRDDFILVAEGNDPTKKQLFYRPMGGAIEFGERSDQTLRREIREEIDAEITNLQYLGTIENVFTYDGQTGHEIVLIYAGEFVDKSYYNESVIIGKEDDGSEFKAVWKSLTEFRRKQIPLYPDGLLQLLENLPNVHAFS